MNGMVIKCLLAAGFLALSTGSSHAIPCTYDGYPLSADGWGYGDSSHGGSSYDGTRGPIAIDSASGYAGDSWGYGDSSHSGSSHDGTRGPIAINSASGYAGDSWGYDWSEIRVSAEACRAGDCSVPETGDSDVDTHIQSESGPSNLDAHPTLVAVDAISEIITQASVFDSPAGRIGDGTALLPETRGSATTVSEPTTPALLAIALAGIVFVRRRSRFPLEPE